MAQWKLDPWVNRRIGTPETPSETTLKMATAVSAETFLKAVSILHGMFPKTELNTLNSTTKNPRTVQRYYVLSLSLASPM
jgi:hypothetical protein